MKKLAAWILVLAAASFQAAADDSQRATPDEARAMVKKAVACYKKVGREKSMAEFCRTDGPFVDRDLYVTVIAMDGLELAHINPKTVGKNMLELRDASGKYHIKERLDAAKSAYWERVDDLVFASGAYKPL